MPRLPRLAHKALVRQANWRGLCLITGEQFFQNIAAIDLSRITAPVNKHKEMRTRLRWTISYKSLYFVHQSLELVRLFTGMLACVASVSSRVIARNLKREQKKNGRGSSSFLDELARNRLLRRLQGCGKGLLVATLDSTESSSFLSSFSSVHLRTVNPLLNPLSQIFPPSLVSPPFQGKKVDKPPLPSPLLFFSSIC